MYHFDVSGSYNPWPSGHPESWMSGVYIYFNRPVQWAPEGWGGEGIPNVYMDYMTSAGSPIDIPMNAGDYLTLIAFDGYSGYCGNSYQGGVTVSITQVQTNQPPVANFTANVTSGTAPLAVQFFDTSTGSPNNWNWDFGDGNISDVQNPVYTYTNAGTYDISLTATNAIGSNVSVKTNYIIVTHDSSAIITTGGSCFIGESGLDISSRSPRQYQIAWWPSAADIHIDAPIKILNVADPLNFFVAPSDFVDFTGSWYVYPNPTLAFIVIDPQLDLGIEDITTGTDVTNGSILRGDELGFRIDSNLFGGEPGTPILIKVWEPDGSISTALVNRTGDSPTLDGILVSSQPFHTGAIWDSLNGMYSPGVYTVRAECNLNGMKDNYNIIGKTVSQNYTITIDESSAPIAEFSAIPLDGIAPLSVAFTDLSTNTPTSWFWSFGDGNTGTEPDPVNVYTLPGVYPVSLTATNTAGSTITTKPGFITVTADSARSGR